MNNVSFRDARPDELDMLIELQRESSLVGEEYREQLLAHPDAIEIDPGYIGDGRVRVAVADDEVVGFSTVLPLDSGLGEVDALFVTPDQMHKGIGRLLVEDLIARARADGITSLYVTANPRTLEFYEKVGFAVTGQTTTRFGPAPRMRRSV